MVNRVILIVMDSVGIGELPDAAKFGDEGSHTLGHIAQTYPEDWKSTRLGKLGLGLLSPELSMAVVDAPQAAYGKAAEVSPGKDTTTGHWEIAGLNLHQPFPMYPEGFPPVIMEKFEKVIGRKSIGNYAASGTVIIEELGDEHVATGHPIVYTSADSVFQIAAHEDIIPVEELYRICQVARDILIGEFAVSRVIARPFTGKSGNYKRTANRKDFSIKPLGKTVLDNIQEAGLAVMGVGKIKDIFDGVGISSNIKTASNNEGVAATIQLMEQDNRGLIFTNLVDFDALFGHRRDVAGYHHALMEFDRQLPDIERALKDEDVLIITADHGNDPTFKGTDHTREYIPILVKGKSIKPGAKIGDCETFADIGATVAEMLGVAAPPFGTSFYQKIKAD